MVRSHHPRSITGIFGFLSAAAVLLAACGGGASPAASAGSPAASSASSKAPATSTAASAAAGSAAGSASAAGKAVTISFGLVGKTATTWPLYVAEKKGFLAQNGVKLQFFVTGNSAGTAQQLAAGSLNMGESGLPDFVRPINQGAPLKIVSGSVITPPYTLVAKSSIKSWADLKGQTVMIGGTKDITRIFWDAMAKANHLAPNDYKLAYAGSTNDRYAALRSGAVAATLLFPPFDFRALSEGYKSLGTVQTYLKDFPFTGYAANVNWAKSHHDTIVSFFKAYTEAINWLYDPKNKAEAVKILGEATNTAAKDAAPTYDLLFTKLKAFSRDGSIPQAGFQELLQSLVTLGDMKAPLPPLSKYLDTSYVDAARQAK